MRFSQLFQETVDTLSLAGIEDAQIDTFQLIDFCFQVSRTQYVLRQDQDVPQKGLRLFRKVVKRRASREPLQYILGVREFWSLDFFVSPAVLIPRPETEFLLDRTMSICKQYDLQPHSVLDMCTGSGVIAVVLAKELQAERVVAVDRSIAALELAARNLKKFELDQVCLVCSDLFSALAADMQFDLIVANPPYISDLDHDSLQPEVRCWEPHSALFGGSGGLDIITRLADTAFAFLRPKGWLFVEIGADQGEEAKQLFFSHPSGAYELVEVAPDWAGRSRVLQARRRGI